jgi:hypothetical protein
MNMNDKVNSLFSSMQSRWKDLALFATWILGVVGGFLMSPPVGTYELYDDYLRRFGQFVVTLFVGLLVLVMWRYQRKKDVSLWGSVSLICLVLCVVLYFSYWRLTVSYTAEYNGVPVVIGSNADYTDFAKAYLESHPQITKEELIMDFAEKIGEIWNPEAVDRRRLILAICYICSLPFFTVAIMSILQALRCQFPDKKSNTMQAENQHAENQQGDD